MIRRWKTRVELASVIFEYIEIFRNRGRATQASACAPDGSFQFLSVWTVPRNASTRSLSNAAAAAS